MDPHRHPLATGVRQLPDLVWRHLSWTVDADTHAGSPRPVTSTTSSHAPSSGSGADRHCSSSTFTGPMLTPVRMTKSSPATLITRSVFRNGGEEENGSVNPSMVSVPNSACMIVDALTRSAPSATFSTIFDSERVSVKDAGTSRTARRRLPPRSSAQSQSRTCTTTSKRSPSSSRSLSPDIAWAQ